MINKSFLIDNKMENPFPYKMKMIVLVYYYLSDLNLNSVSKKLQKIILFEQIYVDTNRFFVKNFKSSNDFKILI